MQGFIRKNACERKSVGSWKRLRELSGHSKFMTLSEGQKEGRKWKLSRLLCSFRRMTQSQQGVLKPKVESEALSIPKNEPALVSKRHSGHD